MSHPPEREPFHRLRETMAAVGFRPSRARGQNFLLDPSLHRWIAEQADPTAADTVVEIGVGLGFLTGELAARAGEVLAIEIEPRLLQLARQHVGDCDHVRWLEADVLSGPGRTLVADIATAGAQCRGRLLVVANLPYSVSGPVLAELTQLERLPDRIVVLVQRELGQRAVASAGDSDYGSLAALLQAMFSVQALRDVSPEVFRPRPRVWSSVLRLERRAEPLPELLAGDARRSFAVFVRALFGQRRKVVRTTIMRAAAAIGGQPPKLGDEVGGKRAEQLSPEQLVELWSRCRPQGGASGASGDGDSV